MHCYTCEFTPPAGRDQPILVEPLGRWREKPRYPSLADGGAPLEQTNKSRSVNLTSLCIKQYKV